MDPSHVSVVEADRIILWILTDNYYDALRPNSAFAKRYRTSPGRSIHAEHGLACYIKTVVGEQTGAGMVDFGVDPFGVMNNMELLNIDIAETDAFALSHGHFDHWSGALEILKRNRTTISDGTPFYVGEEAFLHRYSVDSGAGISMDLGQFSRADLENSGVEIREIAHPTEMIPGGYLTGNIERLTSYESPSSRMLVHRGEEIEPDDFRGEQALFFHLKGKGLVVLSGCAHAGIVNTVKHAQNISGISKVHAILGGFHLTNAEPETVWNTVADIQAMDPDIIAPAHCTGFDALVAFSSSLPDAFTLNTAGTKYTFEA